MTLAKTKKHACYCCTSVVFYAVLMNRRPCACHWRQDEEEADRQTEEDRGDCGRPGVCGGQNHPPPSCERQSGILLEVEGFHRVSEAVHFHICKRLRKMMK